MNLFLKSYIFSYILFYSIFTLMLLSRTFLLEPAPACCYVIRGSEVTELRNPYNFSHIITTVTQIERTNRYTFRKVQFSSFFFPEPEPEPVKVGPAPQH